MCEGRHLKIKLGKEGEGPFLGGRRASKKRRVRFAIRLGLRLLLSFLILGAMFHFTTVDPMALLIFTVIYLVMSHATRPDPHDLGGVKGPLTGMFKLFTAPGRFITGALKDSLALIGVK